MSPTRNHYIDLIKGIGIILMVMGHTSAPLTSYIYLFHMALFFICSGYCYKSQNSDCISSVLHFIKKKFRLLWFPYFIWTVFFSLIHNFLIKINVYTDNEELLQYVVGPHIATTEHWPLRRIIKNILKAVFLRGDTQLSGALWFLAVLLEITVLYCLVEFLLKKLFKEKYYFSVQTVVSVSFLLLGWVCYLSKCTVFGFDKVLSCYSLFHLGRLLEHYNLIERHSKSKNHLFVLSCAILLLAVCNRYGNVSLGSNEYRNPLFLLIASIAGWVVVSEVAFMVTPIKWLYEPLILLGRNTLPIVVLHFLSFKVVSLLGVIFLDMPIFLIAAFPVLFKGGIWWILYTIVGLIIPIFLNAGFERYRNLLFHKLMHMNQKLK